MKFWVCLGFLLSSSALAGDVSFLGIGKTASYLQTNAATVVPVADSPFSFKAFVGLAPAGKLLLAILFTPNGNPVPLILPLGANMFSLEERFDTERDLNLAYPPGVYSILTHTYAHAVGLLPLSLPVNAFPDPPRTKSYEAGQVIDSTADFTLAWEPFGGAAADDLVQLQVADRRGRQVFATPGLGGTNALSGKTTFSVIPSGTLLANEIYSGKLLFGKFTSLDRAAYPNAVSVVGFFSQTIFMLRTSAASSEPVIDTAELPIGFVNQPYSAWLRAQHGTAPYHWVLLEGRLTGGLALSSKDGTITGLPEFPETNTFSVLLTDAAGRTARRVFQMQIQAGSPAIPQPRIDVARVSNGLFLLQFTTLPGVNYLIESSSDLAGWRPVLATNAADSSISVLDLTTQTDPFRFYRVQAPGP